MKQQPVVKVCDLEKLRRDILQLRQTLARQEISKTVAASSASQRGQESKEQRRNSRGRVND
jgi:hypothetical protein